MTPLVLSGVIVYCWGRIGFLLGLIFLISLLIYFTGELGLSITPLERLLLVSSVMSLPLSFYLAGSYLDNYLADKFSFQLPFALVFLLSGSYLLLEQGLLIDQLDHTLNLINAAADNSFLMILFEIISKIIMTTTGLMLIVLLIALIFIVPLAWLMKNSQLNFSWSIPSLNFILILFFLASGYQLILSKLLS